MSYVIVKGKGTRALNDFEWNGLPIRDKRDADGNYVFSDKLFHFYNDCCSSFRTIEEAENHIDYIKRTISENRIRYESVLAGSTDKLMKIASGLRVVHRNESNFPEQNNLVELKPIWGK